MTILLNKSIKKLKKEKKSPKIQKNEDSKIQTLEKDELLKAIRNNFVNK